MIHLEQADFSTNLQKGGQPEEIEKKLAALNLGLRQLTLDWSFTASIPWKIRMGEMLWRTLARLTDLKVLHLTAPGLGLPSGSPPTFALTSLSLNDHESPNWTVIEPLARTSYTSLRNLGLLGVQHSRRHPVPTKIWANFVNLKSLSLHAVFNDEMKSSREAMKVLAVEIGAVPHLRKLRLNLDDRGTESHTVGCDLDLLFDELPISTESVYLDLDAFKGFREIESAMQGIRRMPTAHNLKHLEFFVDWRSTHRKFPELWRELQDLCTQRGVTLKKDKWFPCG